MTEPDRAVIITDPDAIRELAAIMRIHRWRSVAYAKTNLDVRPPRGWTIEAFNAEYRAPGEGVPDWDNVYALCDAVIQSEREERGAKS